MVKFLNRFAIGAVVAIGITSCTGTGVDTTGPPTIPTRGERNSTTALPGQFRDFDMLVESGFDEYIMRFPEDVTSLGLTARLGIRADMLNDYSTDYQDETIRLATRLRDELASFNSAELSSGQIITRDSFVWFLEQEIQQAGFRLLDWPIHFLVTGYNAGLVGLFTEIHPLTNTAQIEDYIARLSTVDTQVSQVLANLEMAVAGGITPPTYVLDITVGQLQDDMAGGVAVNTSIYQSAKSRIEMLGLDESVVKDYLSRIETAISGSFTPAWDSLVQFLDETRPMTNNKIGLTRLPDGDAFYNSLIRFHTSTELSAVEVATIGEQEVERISGEIRDLAVSLGINSDNIGEIRSEMTSRGGFVASDQVVETYSKIIESSRSFFIPYFNQTPQSDLEVVNDPGPVAYYIGPSTDGTRPGSFHAGTGGGSVPSYTMQSLASHEAIPGHHFQIALAQESDLPSPQKFLVNTGMVEGWALYAERLAADLGMYEDDPISDFGRLDFELLRAARLVVDTGIHHQGWSRDKAIAEMERIMGGREYNREVDRYVVYPGQATAYMIGMLEILRIRDEASVDLSDPDDVAQFHERILGLGNIPLSVLANS